MPTVLDARRDRVDRRWGLPILAVAVALVVLGLTSGITRGPASSSAEGASAWLARERPAGPVVTVARWGGVVADGPRFRVITAGPDELGQVASRAAAGSVVAPTDSEVVDRLRAAGEWTVGYGDAEATVLVHEGALPVRGAT